MKTLLYDHHQMTTSLYDHHHQKMGNDGQKMRSAQELQTLCITNELDTILKGMAINSKYVLLWLQ